MIGSVAKMIIMSYSILFATLIIALFATFVILLIDKVGYREKMQIRAPKLISEMFSCDFCLSWWTCLLFAVVACTLQGEIIYILCSIAATPLTRKLL